MAHIFLLRMHLNSQYSSHLSKFSNKKITMIIFSSTLPTCHQFWNDGPPVLTMAEYKYSYGRRRYRAGARPCGAHCGASWQDVQTLARRSHWHSENTVLALTFSIWYWKLYSKKMFVEKCCVMIVNLLDTDKYHFDTCANFVRTWNTLMDNLSNASKSKRIEDM